MGENTGRIAVLTEANKPLEIREYPVVAPPEETVRLRLYLSGVCGTDVHICQGALALPTPLPLGHEFIGTIEAIGDGAACDGVGRPLTEGALAIACVAVPCGECFTCLREEKANCLNFGVTYFRDPDEAPHFFGGFSEHLFSPAKNLVQIPEHISPEAVAAFACAGPTGIQAFGRAGGVSEGDLVVVQGSGPVGLFAAAYAAKAGAKVILIGNTSQSHRVEMAKALGVEQVLDYRQTTAEQRLEIVQTAARELGRGDGADLVFEATGSPQAVPEGMNLTRTLGKYVIPGQYSERGKIDIAPQMITFKAMALIGSSQYTLADIQSYLEFLAEHEDIQAAFAQCISHRYSVAQADQAIADAAAGVSIKGVFVS